MAIVELQPMIRTPTTDEMDNIRPAERNALRGYCEHCSAWYNFTRGIDSERCPSCNGPYSNQQGLQLTTQRTPQLTSKRKARK